ncbi:hypothetical protein ACL03H_01745 [Saccharopolyspora sp. MS10]|uniref:hypothetical protein n=1 Tax=Saccharopolyspora sp. MS10 TaxID=3385973 RepID=UPI0039A3214B
MVHGETRDGLFSGKADALSGERGERPEPSVRDVVVAGGDEIWTRLARSAPRRCPGRWRHQR